MSNDKEHIITVNMLNSIRGFMNESVDNETNENKNDAVPYTSDDDVYTTSLQTCKTQFGADFSKVKDNAMLYYPNDGDVILNFEIPKLGNAKGQFRLKDPSGNGSFVFLNPLVLTDETLNTLKVIYGCYKNWVNSLISTDDIRPLSIMNR